MQPGRMGTRTTFPFWTQPLPDRSVATSMQERWDRLSSDDSLTQLIHGLVECFQCPELRTSHPMLSTANGIPMQAIWHQTEPIQYKRKIRTKLEPKTSSQCVPIVSRPNDKPRSGEKCRRYCPNCKHKQFEVISRRLRDSNQTVEKEQQAQLPKVAKHLEIIRQLTYVHCLASAKLLNHSERKYLTIFYCLLAHFLQLKYACFFVQSKRVSDSRSGWKFTNSNKLAFLRVRDLTDIHTGQIWIQPIRHSWLRTTVITVNYSTKYFPHSSERTCKKDEEHCSFVLLPLQ